MNLLCEIALQAVEVMTLVFGILGMTLALLLLFAPQAARSLGGLLNRSIDLERRLEVLDRPIETGRTVYGHPRLFGALLTAGSLFALFFFLFRFDAAAFARVFFGAYSPLLAGEVAFDALAWIGRVGCVAGVLLGAGLMLVPRRVRAIDEKMTSRVETRSWFEKLERPRSGIDEWFFRHPVSSGLAVGTVSGVLIVLSVINLLR